MDLSSEILLLNKLSELNRQIVSSWRAHLIYQKYEDPFLDIKKINKNLDRLEKSGMIKPIGAKNKALWQVTLPYLNETKNRYEVVGEAYSTGTFCNITAMELLKLTDQRSDTIHITLPQQTVDSLFNVEERLIDELLPADTEVNDWQMRKLPSNIYINKIWGSSIQVHSIKNDWFFGSTILPIDDVNVKTFSLERVLVDGLRTPKYCGGLNEVFRAWVRAINQINMNKIVDCVERYDITILYQRVGFVAETLGLTHPNFQKWKENKAPRGGSRLLNPDNEYESQFSEEWNISINHPVSILKTKDDTYS
jgi:predicted transcriptional regulator of viral defense system